MPRAASLAALFAASLVSPASPAADWPHFLGPNRNGTTDEAVPGAALKPEAKVLWKASIGIGYSGPAVVGDAVYVMGHEGGNEHVRRLNAATGEVVWTHSYPGALIDNLNAGGPGATPTVDGDRVYTVGREGQIRCLKAADGAVVWELKLSDRFGVETPAWGFTASPLVLGDKLILDAGRLVALDKATGADVWRGDEHKVGYGTPTPFTFRGTEYIAHLNNDGLTVAKVADGTEAAFAEYDSQFETAGTSPVVDGDTLWVSVGYDGSCALFRFTGSGLEQVYKNKTMKNHFSNSVPVGKHLYGVSGQSNNSRTAVLVCMDRETGKQLWEQRGGGFGSVAAAGKNLLYLNDKGQLAVVAADPKQFRLLSTAPVLDGQCWTAPVLANGVLYCRNSEGTLAAVQMTK